MILRKIREPYVVILYVPGVGVPQVRFSMVLCLKVQSPTDLNFSSPSGRLRLSGVFPVSIFVTSKLDSSDPGGKGGSK